MTKENLTQWMQQPQNLGKEQTAELKELCEIYPYFSISRMLYLKALQNTSDIRFDAETQRTATYCNDRRKLFYLLFPLAEHTATDNNAITSSLYNGLSGDYFSIYQADEAADKGQSLKSLAQKLKEARLQKVNVVVPQEAPVTIPEEKAEDTNNQQQTLIYTEEEAIRHIKAKKYEEALKILRVLHLNIPKKSVYFADQIRYIEKIIATIHKS